MLPDVEVQHGGDTVMGWLMLVVSPPVLVVSVFGAGVVGRSGCGGGSADFEGDPVGLDGVVAEVVQDIE